ncbi:hypothetical protein [Paenibacillus glycanilyticus]|uniref:VanZ-like domain-containing protein n=1 Tax=Paenibacillus glycanilyticus TaxID=126569 RepID=A0ABQ6GKE3_9BACL|nr:hypothetical protein [Paenibacillus glycanilyticus]GLX70097.1 hypothetical protein MU1_44430 [Paenibacillus glycanilyticus]
MVKKAAVYKYVVFILFLLFTMLVVYASNEVLIRNGDPDTTDKFLFVLFSITFAFGASLHMLGKGEFGIRIRETQFTLMLSIVLVVLNYVAAVSYGQLYTNASGTVESLIRIVLDDKNEAIINVLAGYLFGLSFIKK